jgi:hypothetical protein
MYGAELNTAYNIHSDRKWAEENPQVYDRNSSSYIHTVPQRHIFGLVGGNEVAINKDAMVDIESDLRGTTRPNTFAPWRMYQPPVCKQSEISRANTKGEFKVNIAAKPLTEYQMWSYPVPYTPVPLVKEVYNAPERY